MFYNMKIRTKTLLLACLIFVTVLLSSISLILVEEAQKESFLELSSATHEVTDKILPLALLVKDIKLNIVQVQQWLTDISATRGLDGLNDGFDEAEKQAAAFHANLEKASKLANALSLKDVTLSLQHAKEAFPAYYETGKKMAEAYIAEGPAGGNIMMGEFDTVAATMGEATNELITALEKAKDSRSSLVTQHLDKLAALNVRLSTISIEAGVALFAALIVMVIALHFTMTKPIQNVFAGIAKLNKNDFSAHFRYAAYTDEIGQISATLEEFKDKLQENENLKKRQEEAERKNKEEKDKMMAELASSFEQEIGTVIDTISSAATEMEATARSMADNSSQTNDKAGSVALAAEDASTNVNAVAGASDQLFSSIHEITGQVALSTKISGEAKSKALDTSEKVENLISAANKIGEVVTLITDVAEQTNLLALNATIEAARAGDAGKGFAVVATEVKSLANQTTQATNEISMQITDIQNATKESGAALHEIIEVIQKIDEISNTVASAVEEQSAATSAISENVQNASQGTNSVTQDIREVTQAASETGESAHLVLNAARDLSQQANTLSDTVKGFIARIQA